jgi:hypothetical protein
LELEENIDYYINKLLPEYPRWKQEMNSEFGDKSSCADTFLNHIIPYMVEVVLQDSIYFVNDRRFKRRPFFQMIRVSNYCMLYLYVLCLHYCTSHYSTVLLYCFTVLILN